MFPFRAHQGRSLHPDIRPDVLIECSDGMEHWPGHERIQRPQTTDEQKDKGKQKENRLDSDFWQWPHLGHGLIGRTTLVSRNGKVQWSSVVDTSHDRRWLPKGNPTKVFPETRSPHDHFYEHSARQRAEKGIQYLRTHLPDADFPRDLVVGMLEADTGEMRHLKAFDPFLGNLLEVIPSHHTRSESTVLFPMGELGRELNISRLSATASGNMVFKPTGLPSFAFETPILQISSAIEPSGWTATASSSILIRTHTSASLVRLEHSKVTRELDLTRSETGGVPIVDSRILASGPDLLVANRAGKVYKCNTRNGSKTMQLVGGHEDNGGDDHFWQLGITQRNDECFLASCRAVKHIDLRSAGSVAGIFSLEHPSAVVTSFESPVHDHISRIATTSDVIWLDDRFHRRPLLSFQHYRNFDRTLRVLSANPDDSPVSFLMSRRNSLVTLYDVGRGSDGLLHCNSTPSCLPHNGPMSMAYDGHALVALPSDAGLTFLSLCQRGSIHRQDICVKRPSLRSPITHKWDEDVWALEKQVNQLQTDFGPAAARHYTEVNFRGAYEEIFATAGDENMTRDMSEDILARFPEVWKKTEEIAEGMLTTYDVVSGIGGENNISHPDFFAGTNIDLRQVFDALMRGEIPTQNLAGLAQWHYNIQDMSIPASHSIDCHALNEQLKELELVSGPEGRDPSVQRETEARQQLVLDLALSNDVYSARQISRPETTATRPMWISYSEEPPEIKFGYFRPILKSSVDHYADKNQDEAGDPGVSSPLGVRLLLTEWELGADPRDYTYRDPYGVADVNDAPIPQYRAPLAVSPTTQKKQVPQQRPPTVVAATQPPVVHTAECGPPAIQSQVMQRTHSQQSKPNMGAFSQEPVMSTQVLPGSFDGRPGLGKKPAKKRIGGF